jgi:hypothetical protein
MNDGKRIRPRRDVFKVATRLRVVGARDLTQIKTARRIPQYFWQIEAAQSLMQRAGGASELAPTPSTTSRK